MTCRVTPPHELTNFERVQSEGRFYFSIITLCRLHPQAKAWGFDGGVLKGDVATLTAKILCINYMCVVRCNFFIFPVSLSKGFYRNYDSLPYIYVPVALLLTEKRYRSQVEACHVLILVTIAQQNAA